MPADPGARTTRAIQATSNAQGPAAAGEDPWDGGGLGAPTNESLGTLGSSGGARSLGYTGTVLSQKDRLQARGSSCAMYVQRVPTGQGRVCTHQHHTGGIQI